MDKVSSLSQASGKVKVETFKRTKPYGDGQSLELVQVMIYREGLPESYHIFEEDDVVSHVVRPVRELVLSYEPQSGQIEIIADNSAIRENVVKAFAETMLGIKIEGERVPLKQYELKKLLQEYDFPTDPDDGIQSVKITMMKLRCLESHNKVTLEVGAKEQRSIHEVSKNWFSSHDPMKSGFVVAQVTGEVTSSVIPVLPSHYKCRSTAAALPVEDPLFWIYYEEGNLEKARGMRLQFVYRKRGPSLLVAQNMRASYSRKTGELRGFRKASQRALKSGNGLSSVVMFWLVPQVKLPKLIRFEPEAIKWHSRLPEFVLRHWKGR